MSLSYPTQALCTTNMALTDPRVQGPPGCLLDLPWDLTVVHLKQPKHLLPNPFLPGPPSHVLHHWGQNLGHLGCSSLLTHPATADPLEYPQTHSPCPGPCLSFPSQILLQLPPWSLVSPLPSSLHIQPRDLLKQTELPATLLRTLPRSPPCPQDKVQAYTGLPGPWWSTLSTSLVPELPPYNLDPATLRVVSQLPCLSLTPGPLHKPFSWTQETVRHRG